MQSIPAASDAAEGHEGESELPRDFVGSVAHALSVLRSFDQGHVQMTLSEVSARTGMTRAGARRYLLTLSHLGYVEQNGRLFRLTPKVLELGYAFMSTMPLAEIAQPYLNRLTAETGETSAIAILDDRDVVHLAWASPQRQLVVRIPVGKRYNALYNSTGRVLLACNDDRTIERYLSEIPLVQQTPWSIMDPSRLRDELHQVRRQGYAVVDQEVEEGLCSLAVPIVSRQGSPVAAINIIVNVATVSARELVDSLLPVLRRVADELSLAVDSRSQM